MVGVAAAEAEMCLAPFARTWTEPVKMLKEEPPEVQALSLDSVLAVGGAPCEFSAPPVVGPGLCSSVGGSQCSQDIKFISDKVEWARNLTCGRPDGIIFESISGFEQHSTA